MVERRRHGALGARRRRGARHRARALPGGRRPLGHQEQEHGDRGDRAHRLPRIARHGPDRDRPRRVHPADLRPAAEPHRRPGRAHDQGRDQRPVRQAPWRPAGSRKRPIWWPRRAASCASAISSADVGITGANFLVAETGSAITVTNEGNAELTQGLPRTHIVVATLEKVVPTVEDAFTLLRLLARSATGQEFSTYTTVMTGPKRPGDLDGPDRFHVVLLDNGRTQMLGNELREMLRCIRCGACMNHCPVYLATGGHAYGWVYPGPMGSVLTPQLIGIEQGWPLPNASTFCGRCEEVCPVRIPLPKLMRHWRTEQFEPRPGAARRPLGPGRVGLVRPAAPPLSPGRPDRRRAACACSAATAGWAGRRWPAAGPRRATCRRRRRGTFMSQWRGTGPPVSARDAVLARIRLALPRTPEERSRGRSRRGGAAGGPPPQPGPGPRPARPRGAHPAVRPAGHGGDDRRAPAGDRRGDPGRGQRLSARAQPAAEARAGARAAARPGELGQPAAAARAPRHRRRRRRGRA